MKNNNKKKKKKKKKKVKKVECILICSNYSQNT